MLLVNRDNASLLDIVMVARRVLPFAEGLDQPVLAMNEEKQSTILYIIERSFDFIELFFGLIEKLIMSISIVAFVQYSSGTGTRLNRLQRSI
jgi:hypothetical protein